MDKFPSEIHGYKPVCLCGGGAYGQVWLVVDALGLRRALKIVPKSSLGGEWNREFRGLQAYQTRVKPHPNLIQIFHVEECGSFFYYTMEAADNLEKEPHYLPGTLENWVKTWGALGSDTIVPVFEQLLDGVEALHDAGLIHRDIKPENILSVNGRPKLGDIGLVSTASRTLSLAGTQAYLPPELLTGEEKELRPEVDFYALGKTLYRAFSGQPPDEFPLVPHPLLARPGIRALNALAKRACDVRPCRRVKSVEEFRARLAGEIGWRYRLRSVWTDFLLLPTAWCGALLRRPLRVVFALLLLWVAVSIPACRRLEAQVAEAERGNVFRRLAQLGRAMRQTLTFSAGTEAPSYDLRDFYEEGEAAAKSPGGGHLVNRENYLRHKYPGLHTGDVLLGFSIGDEESRIGGQQTVAYPVLRFSPLALDKVRRRIREREGVGGELWEFSPGIEWREENRRRTLEFSRQTSSIALKKELPLFYEIDSTFRCSGFRGALDLVITAADYLEFQSTRKPEEPRIRQQIRIPIECADGRLQFGRMYFRPQDGFDEKPDVLGAPRVAALPVEDGPLRLQIVTVSNCIRVYGNGQLLYFTQVPFFGGFFSIRCRAEGSRGVSLENFTVYDIRHAGNAKLPEAERFRLPTGTSRPRR